MFKKIIAYIVFIFSTLIYLLSSSTELTNKLAKINTGPHPVIRSDKFRYGDLFGMSYLPEYQVMPVYPSVKLTRCDAKLHKNLSVICDSYIENFIADKSYYCGIDSFFKALIYDTVPLQVTIDPDKKNVLLIEIAERNLRLTLSRTDHINNLVAIKRQGKSEQDNHYGVASFISGIGNFLFNPSINTNLELNAWTYSVFTPVKKLRAYMNYKLFNVIDKNVEVSPDKKYLFYKITVDSSAITSSFQNVPDEEIQSIVEKLNRIYHHSKTLGFNEVYLSIIPNAVSLLYPDYNGMKYNQLVSRVQGAPGLEMPFIDVYSTFKNAPVLMSQRSDSHWSRDGAYTWLNKFNGILLGVSNK